MQPLSNLHFIDILAAYAAVIVFFLSTLVFGSGIFFLLKYFVKFQRPQWENLATFLALGVAAQGLLALFIPVLNPDHFQFIVLWGLLLVLFLWSLIRFKGLSSGVWSYSKIKADLWNFLKLEKMSLVGYGTAVFLACTICCLSITYPENLPDGPYVFKEKVIHNKIQLMTLDLPADNYVAFAFSDFFLRGISFRDVRPLLPGQEVSNRPVLMGLVGAIYRKLFDRIQPIALPIGEYEYLGTKWPAVGKFGFDSDYLLFLFIGIALNSLLFIPILLIGRDFGIERVALAAVLFLAVSPYFLSQAIFIWPKMMAGFFVLMALREILSLRGEPATNDHIAAAWLGLLIALAYHSHPVGVPYLIGTSLYLFYRHFVLKKKIKLQTFFLSYFLAISPWLLWTKFVVGASASLLRQNLLPLYPENPALNFVWVRIVNLFSTIFPTGFSVFPFNSRVLFSDGMLSIFGAIGIFVLPFGILRLSDFYRKFKVEILLILGVPFLLFWGVFTNQVRFTFHGLQPIIALLGFLSFFELSKIRFAKPIILAQFLLFLGAWVLNLNDFHIFNFKVHPENAWTLFVLICILVFQGACIHINLSQNLCKNVGIDREISDDNDLKINNVLKQETTSRELH